MCNMSHGNSWDNDVFTCATRVSRLCSSHMHHYMLTYLWLIHVRVMTRMPQGAGSFPRESTIYRALSRKMTCKDTASSAFSPPCTTRVSPSLTHAYIHICSLVCDSHMCDMTYSHVRHDAFTRATGTYSQVGVEHHLRVTAICIHKSSHMCDSRGYDMTHSHVRRNAFILGTRIYSQVCGR